VIDEGLSTVRLIHGYRGFKSLIWKKIFARQGRNLKGRHSHAHKAIPANIEPARGF
jgi:hypothetical protein